MTVARTVGVLGASGFIGHAICAAVEQRGFRALRLRAPRLITTARTRPSILRIARATLDVGAWSRHIDNCEVVVNAAGIASPAAAGDDLFGANALLPGVIAASLAQSGFSGRFVHVSSAAVQGRRRLLDESLEHSSFSHYSLSKSLGEHAARLHPGAVVFRPTSVHGVGRRTTLALSRLASSPLATVAGDGSAPTPQVLVQNVGDAIAHVALSADDVPPVVLQPSEGLTTSSLLRLLGGREPRRMTERTARAMVQVAYAASLLTGRVADARRLEMLWFGQAQVSGWLSSTGWTAVAGNEAWRCLV